MKNIKKENKEEKGRKKEEKLSHVSVWLSITISASNSMHDTSRKAAAVKNVKLSFY